MNALGQALAQVAEGPALGRMMPAHARSSAWCPPALPAGLPEAVSAPLISLIGEVGTVLDQLRAHDTFVGARIHTAIEQLVSGLTKPHLPNTCPRCTAPCGALSMLCSSCWSQVPRALRKRWSGALAHFIAHNRAAAAIQAWARGETTPSPAVAEQVDPPPAAAETERRAG